MSQVQIHDSISKIPRADWNALIKDQNPFVKHEFFHALEKGNCIKGQSGWHPLYFVAIEPDNISGGMTLSAALVVFIKTDSYGEFIFDWQWAQAYGRYGLEYYPKLTLAVPYSPITAPKLLGNLETHRTLLLPALFDFYQKEELTGLHALFTQTNEGELLKTFGLKERDSFQYHWRREGVQSFDQYLNLLKKNRRKSIKRERKVIESNQLDIQWLSGTEITAGDIDFFYECYLTTIDKKWSQAYLSKEFFFQLFKDLPNQCLLLLAKEAGKPIASALYLRSETTLFGRYWGCKKEVEFLHFELCLYKGLEKAIEEGLEFFEAGAQGDHKRLRGFYPTLTKSWHHLKREDFFEAIEKFLIEEKVHIKEVFKNFEEESPYKTPIKHLQES